MANKYKVSVFNPDRTEGAGPVTLFADNESDAKAIFAANEGTSVVRLSNVGMTEWVVEQIS